MQTRNSDITLTIDGRVFAGWERLSFSRSIEHMSSAFHLEVDDRLATNAEPWRIGIFNSCVLRIGSDPVMTGYVDTVAPELDHQRHRIAVQGRSKTEDLIDCTPDIQGGQFNGYTLDKIARAICAPFGIGVVVQTAVGAPYPDATMQRQETGYRFLERLARLRSVLLTDDANGNLVITRAGATRATTKLRESINIRRISARLSSVGRFSECRVKTQSGTQTPAPGPPSGPILNPVGGAPPAPNPASSVAAQRAAATPYYNAQDPQQTPAVTVTAAVAYDHGVPRFRPRVIIGKSTLDAAGAAARAKWEAAFAFGRSVHVQVDVKGWRQDDGTLWTPNTLASVVSPTLDLNGELLIVSAEYELGMDGMITRLGLGPVEGYTPDPAQVSARTPCKPNGQPDPAYTTVLNPVKK